MSPLGAALLALLWSGFLSVLWAAQFGPTLQDVIASPCTLEVVLVTVKDATSRQSGWWFGFQNRDLLHSYTLVSGELNPGENSCKLDDFKRLSEVDSTPWERQRRGCRVPGGDITLRRVNNQRRSQ